MAFDDNFMREFTHIIYDNNEGLNAGGWIAVQVEVAYYTTF